MFPFPVSHKWMKILIFFQNIIIHLVLRDRYGYQLKWTLTETDPTLTSDERKAASKILQKRAGEIQKEITKILRPGNGKKGIAYQLPDQSVSAFCDICVHKCWGKSHLRKHVEVHNEGLLNAGIYCAKTKTYKSRSATLCNLWKIRNLNPNPTIPHHKPKPKPQLHPDASLSCPSLNINIINKIKIITTYLYNILSNMSILLVTFTVSTSEAFCEASMISRKRVMKVLSILSSILQ